MQKHKDKNSLKNSIYQSMKGHHVFDYNSNHLNNLKKFEKGSEMMSLYETLEEKNFHSTNQSSKEMTAQN